MRAPSIVFAIVTLMSISVGCGRDSANSINPTGDNSAASEPVAVKPVWLGQGWNAVQSEWFYHSANQGSHLVPYDWFLCLEEASGTNLFRDGKHIEKLRFLPGLRDNLANPDGLPVGFVKDPKADAQNRIWLGLTCAACHTADIVYKKVVYRVDGAPGQGDIQTLLEELTASLRATRDNDDKFSRFAAQVLKADSNVETERKKLRDDLNDILRIRQEFQQRNATKLRYGFGRVDAFGIIMNEVLQHALQVPGNGKEPNAPVSYPFLWDTPQHDFVQWNGSAPNRPLNTQFVGPLSRNVGEVLGVFGEVEVSPQGEDLDGYPSSARRFNLIVIEELLKKLMSPQWPNAFPPIDQTMAAKGRQIYVDNCRRCHDDIDRADKDRSVTARMTAVDEIGTDRAMAANFASRTADPGPLKGRKRLIVTGALFGNTEPAGDVLVHVIAGVIIHRPLDVPNPEDLIKIDGLLGGHELWDLARSFNARLLTDIETRGEQLRQDILEPLQQLYKQPLGNNVVAYKGRPLNGIWATAPYLHNGSVPNLEQLFLPAKDRVTHFYVGSREFDPDKVGFKSEQSFESAFEFCVFDGNGKPIAGNSNAGHEYGTNLTPDERRQLIEYLKSL